jgi:DNA-directed RNA polymerase subunit RPC12/RpoP
MYLHSRQSLSDNPEKVVCDKCGTQVLAHKYKQHVNDVHKNKRVYKCPYCADVAYSHKRIIDKHLALVHGIGAVKPRRSVEAKKCNQCGKQVCWQ